MRKGEFIWAVVMLMVGLLAGIMVAAANYPAPKQPVWYGCHCCDKCECRVCNCMDRFKCAVGCHCEPKPAAKKKTGDLFP